MSVGIFLLFKQREQLFFDSPATLKRIISSVSSVGLGIYLLHVILLDVTRPYVLPLAMECPSLLPAWVICIFFLAYVICIMLKRIPVVGKKIV